jgi:hypothetical protein
VPLVYFISPFPGLLDTNDSFCSQIVFFKNPKDHNICCKMENMIQKINLFCFYCFFITRKSINLEVPNAALQGLDRQKNSSATYCLIVVLLNLKFQLDKLKNNAEKAIIVFCSLFWFLLQ